MLKHCSLSTRDVRRQSSLTRASDRSGSPDSSHQFSQECDRVSDGLVAQDRLIERQVEEVEVSRTYNDESVCETFAITCETIPSALTIRVYTKCLRPHMTYRTVRITPQTTSKQVITGLLSRFRMKHRDPKLFYLTMEVTVNQTL